jgi:predicted nucleic acid-binding protein
MRIEPTVIYLDSSVILARLFVEPHAPAEELWRQSLTSSRLLMYEVWTRLHGRALHYSRGEQARVLLDRITFLDLTPAVLERALQPFSMPIRTLDALHLASIVFLLNSNQTVQLASYDNRMNAVARTLGIALVPLR